MRDVFGAVSLKNNPLHTALTSVDKTFMACLVITRNGWGDVLLFDTEDEARYHPVTQDGDAIIVDPEDLAYEYNRIEWSRLLFFADIDDLALRDAMPTLSKIEAKSAQLGSCRRIYDRLIKRAQRAPNDRDGVFAMVARNRKALTYKENRMSVEPDKDLTPEEQAAKAEERKAAKATALAAKRAARTEEQKKRTAARAAARVTADKAKADREAAKTAAVKSGEKDVDCGTFEADSKVYFGKGSDGKRLSHKRTPYREGTNREARWHTIKAGMTVRDLLGTTVNTLKNLKDMTDKGWIVLHPVLAGEYVEPPEDPETETTETENTATEKNETEATEENTKPDTAAQQAAA